MSDVYMVHCDETNIGLGKSIAVFSSLEGVKVFLQNKVYGEIKGKYTLVKGLIDGLPVILNENYKYISVDEID